MGKVYQHGKNEKLEYTFDWGPELAQEGDTITGTPVWSGETGLTLSSASSTTTTTTTWVQITASVSRGKVLTLTNRITTAAGRIYEAAIDIQVVQARQL